MHFWFCSRDQVKCDRRQETGRVWPLGRSLGTAVLNKNTFIRQLIICIRLDVTTDELS